MIVAFEVLARTGMFGDEPTNLTPVPREITQPSDVPGLPYRLRPGTRGAHRVPGRSHVPAGEATTVVYHINRLGFRGPETTLERPRDRIRVVALGDSFTFGTGVAETETWPAALGAELGSGTEVLNLGVMAYDTTSEVTLLEVQGLALEPEVVLVAFHVNDAGGGGHLRTIRTERAKGLPFWRRASRLLDALASRVERRRAREMVLDSYKRSFAPEATGWAHVRTALRRLRELSNAHGFEAVVALYPLLWDPLDPYPLAGVHATVSTFARETGLKVVDLAPAFAGEEAPALWIHPHNHHPNARAHAIAARALAAFLRDECLLSGCVGVDRQRPGGESSATSIQRGD